MDKRYRRRHRWFDVIRRRQPAEAHAAITRLLLATQRDFNALEKVAVRAAVAVGDQLTSQADSQEQDIGW